ncbi:MAG: glycosyltransferase family 2 protein [Acidobacteriota bacterium]
MTPSLDIVIVNWNAGPLLRQCLVSMSEARAATFSLARVIVVDNASSDDSLDQLAALPIPLTVVCNQSNRGFGAACNQGASHGDAPYVLFLNPDTVLGPESLSIPLAYLEEPAHADVGVVGVQLVDGRGQVARSSARKPTPAMIAARILGLDVLFPRRVPLLFMTDWDHQSTRDVDHVIGAFYLIRRDLLCRLQGFDERFFVYLEDLDMSVRAQQVGARVVYLSTAQAGHIGGGTSDRVKASRIAYSLHSRILYGFKHFTRGQAMSLAAGTLIVEPFLRIARAVGRGSREEFKDTVVGYIRLWGRVFAHLAQRRRPVAH